MKERHVFTLMNLVILLCVQALIPAMADETDKCLTPTKVSTRTLTSLRDESGFVWSKSKNHQVLAGTTEYGPFNKSLLFLKKNNGWNSFLLADKSSIVGRYKSSTDGTSIVLTMRDSGGPGPSFDVVLINGNDASVRCYSIDFPREINNPDWNGEYLHPEDLNIEANGTGALHASAVIERSGTSEEWWFRYETKDHARTWSTAKMLLSAPEKLSGIYDVMTGDGADSSINELIEQSREQKK